jgi:hypothetical protein
VDDLDAVRGGIRAKLALRNIRDAACDDEAQLR